MTWRDVLDVGSDLATIATAAVAIFFFSLNQVRSRDQRKRLTQYLKDAKLADRAIDRNGKRTPMRTAADLSMTLSDVWNAAANNPKIKTANIFRDGLAVGIMFYYDGD